MAMNLPTPPTQGPRRWPAGWRGSLARSRPRSLFTASDPSPSPATSPMTLETSAIPPSASNTPGRSAPAEPTRTSFKQLSLFFGPCRSRRRQAGRTDRFELFVGEDEFLVAEGFRLGHFARGQALHQAVDFAAHVVELGAAQDAPGVHIHVIGHAVIGVRVVAHLDDR